MSNGIRIGCVIPLFFIDGGNLGPDTLMFESYLILNK